jgi:recombinational DNA repair protein (RecF pathway)
MKDEELTRQRRDVLVRLIVLQLVLLREVGLHPVLKACANCRRALAGDWHEVYFSSSANGLICRDCEVSFPDRTRVNRKLARTLADLRQIADADEVTLDEMERMLVHHFTSILGRRLKLAQYVEKD